MGTGMGGGMPMGGAPLGPPPTAPPAGPVPPPAAAAPPPAPTQPATVAGGAQIAPIPVSAARAERDAAQNAAKRSSDPLVLARRIAAAHRYIVLWSREGARAPALRAAAKHALRAGKLASVRLDKTPPPVGAASAIALPRGRAQAHAWRRLLEQTEMPAAAISETRRQPTSRITGLVMLLLMGLVTATAGYYTNTSFAAQVDGAVAKVQAMVSGATG